MYPYYRENPPFGKVYSPNVQIEKTAASIAEPEEHSEIQI